MVADFLHVIPIRDDIVRDGVLQCQDTALALRLVTNITVFWVHASRSNRGTANRSHQEAAVSLGADR